jgi:hypothetical protein
MDDKAEKFMRPRGLLVLLVLLGLAGCVETGWHKPGATPQDFAADSAACQDEARRNGYVGILAGPVRMRELQEQCLTAHGWTLSAK